MLIDTNRNKLTLLFLVALVVILLLFLIKQNYSISSLKAQLSESKTGEVVGENSGNFFDYDFDCPYYVDTDLDLFSYNEVSVAYPPKPLDQKAIAIPEQVFNPNADEFDGRSIYSTGGEKHIDIEMNDINRDGTEEQIVSMDTAMNHTPHVALIVKNKKIIFKETGAETYIFDIGHGRFKVHKTLDHLTGEEVITSYRMNENNEILPIWEQKLCNVRVRDN